MERTTDPVCGMESNPETAPKRSEREGRAHQFCSAARRNEFDEGPARHASRAGAKAAGPAAP